MGLETAALGIAGAGGLWSAIEGGKNARHALSAADAARQATSDAIDPLLQRSKSIISQYGPEITGRQVNLGRELMDTNPYQTTEAQAQIGQNQADIDKQFYAKEAEAVARGAPTDSAALEQARLVERAKGMRDTSLMGIREAAARKLQGASILSGVTGEADQGLLGSAGVLGGVAGQAGNAADRALNMQAGNMSNLASLASMIAYLRSNRGQGSYA